MQRWDFFHSWNLVWNAERYQEALQKTIIQVKLKHMRPVILITVIALLSADKKITDITESNLPFADLGMNSMDAASGDLDGDGDLDLVVACEFCPNYILINEGGEKFSNQSKRLPAKRHDSEDIALADFDKDGDLDIVFVSEDDFQHEYYRNDGNGNFTDASTELPSRSKSNSVAAADVDRDGYLDLILGNEGQDMLWINDGKGNFVNETQDRLPADTDVTQDVKAADLNKDGHIDLVLGNEDRGRILINNGKGKFTELAGALPQIVSSVETRKVELHDMDGDGHLDILLCNVAFKPGRDKKNLMLKNDGNGFFKDMTAEWYKAENSFMSLDAQFIDLNNDAKKDLMVVNGFGGRVQYLVHENGAYKEVQNAAWPAFEGLTIITAFQFKTKDNNQYVYLGAFRGGDKLLKISDQ